MGKKTILYFFLCLSWGKHDALFMLLDHQETCKKSLHRTNADTLNRGVAHEL